MFAVESATILGAVTIETKQAPGPFFRLRAAVCACVVALAGCGSADLELVARSDVGQVDFLTAAVFGPSGVLTRIDRLPASGAPTLPGRLKIDRPGREAETLTLMLWARRGAAIVGFADLVLPAQPTAGLVATLVVPSGDADSDGVPDRLDRCHFLADPDQVDTDRDGSGDVCGCKENQLAAPTFATAADFSLWTDHENSTLTLVDGPAGAKRMRVCRTTAGPQFGTTAAFPLPAGAVEVELSVVMSGTGTAAPLLRQGAGCSSWDGSCHAGTVVQPVALTAAPTPVATRLKPSTTGSLELELTSFDQPLSTCFDVQQVCLVVTKP